MIIPVCDSVSCRYDVGPFEELLSTRLTVGRCLRLAVGTDNVKLYRMPATCRDDLSVCCGEEWKCSQSADSVSYKVDCHMIYTDDG